MKLAGFYRVENPLGKTWMNLVACTWRIVGISYAKSLFFHEIAQPRAVVYF
jgi:hypothetical protein